MGLKGAPSYFQQVMATVVLAGLLYILCELYLDDILVFGKTQDEFVGNLTEVFERFRLHKLTLNPAKCKLGLPKVQFVGHELTQEGITFSDKKRQQVLHFPRPTNVKGLRMFLGLANYFRSHVHDHTGKVRILQNMLSVDRNKKLDWNETTIAAFEHIKLVISECPTLFFLDSNAPVFLQTDASDYGIGAYLFQLINGVERPVRFLSKSLSSGQLGWSVPEKEAYAIFYAFTKLEYLIRDIKFTLQTDHKNLTYINTAGSPKVLRWKLAIQEYSFDMQYIKGEDNKVADAMSRLCVLESFEPHQLNNLDSYIIPADKMILIEAAHNELVGHHGTERTLAKLRAQGHDWLYMRTHVKSFIKKCPFCQKMSYKKIVAQTVPFTTSRTEPMECLNIDSIGPLPGDYHILVIICCFTRFVEFYTVPNTTAIEAAKALLQHVGRFGAPAQIRSDRGPQFANDIIEEFLKLIGTEHLLTLAYSSQENSIVERANKEVMRHLRAIIFQKNIIDDWQYSLPLVQRIMNASVHNSIGVSPAQLLFGNSIDLDRGVLLPYKPENSAERIPLSEWAVKMLSKQEELLNAAKSSQEELDNFHIAERKTSSEPTEFPVNSYVLVNYHDRPPTKMHTPLKGPMRVISFSNANYTLQDLVTNRTQNIHVSKLRPFVYDGQGPDPRVIANKDKQVWDVQAILGHTGVKRKKSEMEFKVHWVGFPPEDYTMGTWKDLSSNAVLHRYLIDNGMKSIIPKSYRNLYE
jgi:transposase InsO family protein